MTRSTARSCDAVCSHRSTRASSIAKLADLQGKRILDLGCNWGHNTFDLADHGAAYVLGVEARKCFLEKANKVKAEEGYGQVEFRACDARCIDELGLGTFDLCLCAGLLYHMKNPIDLLCRLRRICRELALETHVAPENLRSFFRARRKYRTDLSVRTSEIDWNGKRFRGRVHNYRSIDLSRDDITCTLDEESSFWLTPTALQSALEFAGFEIVAFYYRTVPSGLPPIEIEHGLAKSKAFAVAKVP